MNYTKLTLTALLAMMAFSAGAARIQTDAEIKAEWPDINPSQLKAVKQAQTEMEELTAKQRGTLVFMKELDRCIVTAQAYYELVEDLPEGLFIKESSRYCFMGGTAAHERNGKTIDNALKEIGNEKVSSTVKTLLQKSFLRGASIGHDLEMDALKERFMQLTNPELATHEYFNESFESQKSLAK